MSTHDLTMFFSTKALLQDVEQLAMPMGPIPLEGLAQQYEQEAEAMSLAEEALVTLNAMVDMHAGKDTFAQAMDIAFAPMPETLEAGLKRVAEYYRRAELIERL